jgi:hypothetical protein
VNGEVRHLVGLLLGTEDPRQANARPVPRRARISRACHWRRGRDDLDYRQKLAEYRRLADAYFDVDAYRDFCAAQSSRLRSAKPWAE